MTGTASSSISISLSISTSKSMHVEYQKKKGYVGYYLLDLMVPVYTHNYYNSRVEPGESKYQV